MNARSTRLGLRHGHSTHWVDRYRTGFFAALALLAVPSTLPCAAVETVADHAVQLTAEVQSDPAKITLSWQPDVNATSYSVYRKTRDGTAWELETTLGASATSHVDAAVSSGSAFEYRVVKTAIGPTANYIVEGYVYAGIRVNFTDARGHVILIVDNTHAAELVVELARLERDLVGDGWRVTRFDVARGDSVLDIANAIKEAYNADPSRVNAVFLLGHVPVPYSGNLNPDAHPDHLGAWPADAYYGDVDGVWTDNVVTNATAGSVRNRNTIGDGKFDQNVLPSSVELQVGRVDLADLPSFGLSEVELLRRYLNKNHAFRHRVFNIQSRGLIDDHFGVFRGEAFAANGWQNFAPLCGRANVVAGDWQSTLGPSSDGYLLAFGCGIGSYASANGVMATQDIALREQRTVFTLLFGSYFGDWDSTDNLMRAVLATSPYALTSGWAGRPHWHLHHMGLGETIGFSVRVTQNNQGLYSSNYMARGVHVALMGDPTLRLHPVAPPSGLMFKTNATGGLRLTWKLSPDQTVVGYHIYRGNTSVGPFSRITVNPVTSFEFVDLAGSGETYMVRAVKLETTGSGSYYNLSQGVFQDARGSFGPPQLTVEQASPGNATGVGTGQSMSVSLSWPWGMFGYHLESKESLFGSGDWTPLTVPLRTSAGRITATVSGPGTASSRYLRLSEP